MKIVVLSAALQAKTSPFSSLLPKRSAGDGAISSIKPIILPEPISLAPDATNTGKKSCFAKPIIKPCANSSSERLPSSKYFSINPSSFSAAISTNALCISLALAISDSGIGFFSGLPPVAGNSYITILKASTIWLKLSPEFSGY